MHVTLVTRDKLWRLSLQHDDSIMLQRETPEFIPPEMWPPNSPDFNPVDYSVWGMLQQKVYCSRIHDVKELKDDAAADDDDVC